MTRFAVNALMTAGGCAFVTAVLAQAPVVEREPPPDTLFFVQNAAPVVPFGGPFQVVGFGGGVPGNVVAGKPYAADSITESTQVLADGNRIVARNEARVMRDAKGRTRREQTLRGFGPATAAREPVVMVTINDPVAEVSYILDTAARTAQPSRPFRMATGVAGTFTAAVPPPEGGGGPPANVFVGSHQTLVLNGVGAGEPARFDLQLPPGMPPGAPPPFGAGSVSFASASEDLGEQVLEGVLARGTRRTQTIPAGTFGNERPIQIVAEQWYSPDLETVVSSRNYDPRVGETTYRLVNVVRGDQPPDLFTVPSSYTLLPEPRPEIGVFGGAGQGVRIERGASSAPAGRN